MGRDLSCRCWRRWRPQILHSHRNHTANDGAHPQTKKTTRQVATLEVALRAGTDAVTLANLMPGRWAAFIRNSPVEDVKPLGTTRL